MSMLGDGRIVLEAEVLTDEPWIADEFRRRSFKDTGLTFDVEAMPRMKGDPVRFYGWRSGLAIYDQFSRLAVEREGRLIDHHEMFPFSLDELRGIADRCRAVLSAYEEDEERGEEVGTRLVPRPLAITVVARNLAYDPDDYVNELERAVRLADILSGMPGAEKATYYYSWFTWI